MKYLTFDKILFVSAMLLALCGAYFSIIGICTLFSGAMLSTGIMAGAIELAKFCSVTFLYRYWRKINKVMKNYMCIASIVLMIITSGGVGGMLLSAYQKSSMDYKANQEKITMVEGQKTYLNDKISQSKTRIQTLNDMRKIQEARLNEGLTNVFLVRNPIQLKQLQEQTVGMITSADTNIKTEQDKIQTTVDEIQKINQQVNEMKFTAANKKDIRTFQFVADQFGTTLDNVAKWFILVIIFVFDPLAIALILAYNVVTYKENSEYTNSTNLKKVEIVNSPETESASKKELIVDTIPFVPESNTASFSLGEFRSPSDVVTSKNINIPNRQPWM
jgi:hypothetical protein